MSKHKIYKTPNITWIYNISAVIGWTTARAELALDLWVKMLLTGWVIQNYSQFFQPVTEEVTDMKTTISYDYYGCLQATNNYKNISQLQPPNAEDDPIGLIIPVQRYFTGGKTFAEANIKSSMEYAKKGTYFLWLTQIGLNDDISKNAELIYSWNIIQDSDYIFPEPVGRINLCKSLITEDIYAPNPVVLQPNAFRGYFRFFNFEETDIIKQNFNDYV